MPLTQPRLTYKPFEYPWAFEAYKTQQSLHWLPEEVPMAEDVRDWNTKMTPAEKNLAGNILKFFTQGDMLVADAYINHYMPYFKPVEIRMMMSAFAASEANHVHSYGHLNDTLGIPDSEYSAFLNHIEMKAKHDFLQTFNPESPLEVAKTIAAFSAGVEGTQLFSSFAMLMNFSQHNLLKGVGQIVAWSSKDECFVEGTEVLTEKGWTNFADLTDEKVAQYCSATKHITFTKPTRKIVKQYTGKVIEHAQHKGAIEFVTTPDHDVLWYKDSGKASGFFKTKAKDVPCHFRHKLPCAGYTGGTKLSLTPYERFLIAYQADGHKFRPQCTGEKVGHILVNISLTRKRKIKRFREILRECQFSWKEFKTDHPKEIKFSVKAPVDVSKTFNWVKLSEIDAHWCREFLEELSHWDGHLKNGDYSHIYYSTVDGFNADVVQAIAALSGHRCHRGVQHDHRKKSYKSVHRLSITEQDLLPTGAVYKTEYDYDGKVYCVTVPKGNIIVRYNNRVIVSGNCLHSTSMIKLFNVFVKEEDIDRAYLKPYIVDVMETVVKLEDAFIDKAFELGPVKGLKPLDIKNYVRYIGGQRMEQLGYENIFGKIKNPLPWMDAMLALPEHANFFEQRVTEYTKGTSAGDWETVF